MKLCKEAKEGVTTSHRYYAGAFEYDNARALKMIHHEEGIVEVSGGTSYSYEYFLKDHLGNTRVMFKHNNVTGIEVLQVADYYPFGSRHIPASLGGTNKYLYNGKELQEELGMNWLDYGARFYDPQIGRWHTIDPLAELDIDNSPYVYVCNAPINFIDPDGMSSTSFDDVLKGKNNQQNDGKIRSTHTDEKGNVIWVYNDGDLGVYKHNGARSKADIDKKRKDSKSTSGGGEKMGETEFWDEFIDPDTRVPMTGTQILFGQSWDGPIAESAYRAETMDLYEISQKSKGEKEFDLKYYMPNQGRLLNRKYISSRSAGNYLAGYNAAGGTLGGIHISYDMFQRMAGALHVTRNKITWYQLMDAATGVKYGSPPAYGEEIYQYRMSKMGWDDRNSGK